MLLLLRLLPRFAQQACGWAHEQRSICFWLGLRAAALLLILGYVMLITVLGSLLGLIFFGLLWLGLLLGRLLITLLLATRLARGQARNFFHWSLFAFAAHLLLSVLLRLPFVGGGLYLFCCCWGLGSLLHTLRLSQNPITLSSPPPLPKPSQRSSHPKD